MLKFSANIGMLFQEYPFLERFEACRKAGFKKIEFPFPYDYDPKQLHHYLCENDLELVLFDFPAGNWEAGDRGYAVNPDLAETFQESVEKALDYASTLDVKALTCLVGNRLNMYSFREQWKVLVKNLKYASDRLGTYGITLLVEILNTNDHPYFFLSHTRDALDLLSEVQRKNCLMQYDVYHLQKMEGNLTETVRNNLNFIGHIQIADVPGRHQPGTGEINYNFFLNNLEKMGYTKTVGLEYFPLGDTVETLEWMKPFIKDGEP